jgi:hypothetical protein
MEIAFDLLSKGLISEVKSEAMLVDKKEWTSLQNLEHNSSRD